MSLHGPKPRAPPKAINQQLHVKACKESCNVRKFARKQSKPPKFTQESGVCNKTGTHGNVELAPSSTRRQAPHKDKIQCHLDQHKTGLRNDI